jgi:thiol-disulfide isomerase/thioredoxin
MKIVILFLCLLIANIDLLAQNSNDKPIKIGDEVPNISFKMLNHFKPTLNLYDYKDKLVILDFWATWCGACISGFPRLKALQDKFGDSIQVILVNEKGTGDSELKVKLFLEDKENKKASIQLPTAILDTTASQVFPHRSLPHCVVINNGIVKAVTNSEYLTEYNIREYINGGIVKTPIKTDYFANLLLNLNPDFEINDSTDQVVFQKGKVEGLTRRSQPRILDSVIRGMSFRNCTIGEIYRIIFRMLKRQILEDTNKFIVEVKEPSLIDYDDSKLVYSDWSKKNLYTYEIVVPKDQSDSVFNYSLQDLNRRTGYIGKVEKKIMKCYVLKVLPKGFNVKPNISIVDKEIRTYKADEVKNLVNRIRGQSGLLKFPIVDETNYPGKLDYYLPVEISDFVNLRKSLNKQGFDLVEGVREIEVVVLRERDNT